MSGQAVALLVALFLAHFLGDFTPLASARMQEAKAAGTPLGPIALHALVHAVLVGIAVLAISRSPLLLVAVSMAIEFWTHFGLDWLRGKCVAWKPALADSNSQAFWTAFGLDQLAHTLVLVGIAALVLS